MEAIDETRSHVLTEYAIVAVVILIGIAAVTVLMQGATSTDVAALVSTR